MNTLPQDTDNSISFEPRNLSLREQITERLEANREEAARLAKLEHTLPSRWLDMTRDQIYEKTGVWVHF